MSALAGIVSFEGSLSAEARCAEMLGAQQVFGPHGRAVAGDIDVAFGRALYKTLAEDDHDRQPLTGGDGAFMLVADLRIDNRDELILALGALPDPPSRMSDAALLLRGWEIWGEGLLDRLIGDFAFAIWDRRRRRLILARDPLGERPLYYTQSDGVFAFASMPQGLHALNLLPRSPDREQAAAHVADLFPVGSATYFENISRVQTGHILLVDDRAISTRRYWQPRRGELRLPDDGAYAEAFREQIDRATNARLRRNGGLVASHLSAGYDSSTVAATAARLLARTGETLLAYTAAPRQGFDGPVPRGRIADESAAAAEVARLHPNMEHEVLRSSGNSPFELLEPFHALVQQPMGHVCNLAWGVSIQQRAQARGASVLLHGQAGNYTISAGGRGNLADFVREERWLRWWHEVRAMVALGPIRWRGALDNSFGGWLPAPLYSFLRRRFLHSSTRLTPSYLTQPEWSASVEHAAAERFRDPRPAKDSFAFNIRLLQGDDPGNFRKANLARFGLDQRDPTGDRRIIEFCLSLPLDQLLRDGVARPLAKRALADRLPSVILNSNARGYQGADWYEQIGPEQTRQFADRLAASPMAASVVNFERVREMLARWPTGDWDKGWVISEYRSALLRALAVADFLRVAADE